MNHGIKLLIRADAGPRVGTGHVMRTLALGQHWAAMGGKVTFVCGDLPGGLVRRIEREGFQLFQIQNQNCDGADARDVSEIASIVEPDWILLDGYRFGDKYQSMIANSSTKLAVLDDWGHADHSRADLVINQNAYAHPNGYPLRSETGLLTGPKYALLRKEFSVPSVAERNMPAEARRILVTFGGADPDNWTLQTLEVLSGLKRKRLVVDCVVGASYQHVRELELFKKTANMSLRCHRNVDRMSVLMERVDLAITAGGSTCYELARCGVPSIVVSIADNQLPVAEAMNRLGVMHSLGKTAIGKATPERKIELAKSVRKLLNNQEQRRTMSETGKQLVDGKGAQRVAHCLASQAYPLRNVTMADADQMLRWRNDPEVRAVSFETSVVARETHVRWLESKLKSDSSHLWIAENQQHERVGLIRFENEGESSVISIVLGEKFRGKGLGRALISMAAEKLFETSTVKQVVAQIKQGNEASERAFKAAGFVPVEPVILKGQMAVQMVKYRDGQNSVRQQLRKSA